MRQGIFRAFWSYQSNKSWLSGVSRTLYPFLQNTRGNGARAYLLWRAMMDNEMTRQDSKKQPPGRRAKGFARASVLLSSKIRKAGESRGFAVTRLLTHWSEIVGPDIAGSTRPVKVGYGRDGFGATLTVLTTGANAPMLEMQKEKLKARVNACYGYAAISKIRITQTAPTGFAEGQAEFQIAAKSAEPAQNPAKASQAHKITAPVGDENLRQALEALGANILSRDKN